MEIIVSGEYLDLFKDTDITVDYTIFPISDIENRSVSFTNDFSVPYTDKNNRLLSPFVNGTNKYNCQIINDEETISFNGTLYVNDTERNIIEEAYSITIVDSIKEKLETLKDGIENLVDNANDSFMWEFTEQPDITTGLPVGFNVIKGHAPNDDSGDDFFMTSCNFNGEKYLDYTGKYPVYAAIPNSNIYQFLWSWKYSSFFNKAMDYAGVTDFNTLLDSYVVVSDAKNSGGDITFGELSVNISAPFMPAGSRDMSFVLSDLDGIVAGYTDFANQIGIKYVEPTIPSSHYNSLTGLTDTVYDISVSPFYFPYQAQITTIDLTTPVGYWLSSPPVISVYLNIMSLDGFATYASIFLSNLTPLSNDGWTLLDGTMQDLEYTDGFTARILHDFLLEGTTELKFALSFSFTPSTFRRQDSGGTIDTFFNGNYFIDDDIFNSTTSFAIFESGFSAIIASVSFTSTKNVSPIIYDTLNRDYILPEESLTESKIKISDVINDIFNRYNLGIWEDSAGSIKITNMNSRYNGTIDLSYKLLDERTKIDFSNDVMKTFTYRNKRDSNVTTIIKHYEEEYTLGDVKETIVNANGYIDETITLNSVPASKNFYGDKADSGLSAGFFRENGDGVLFPVEHWAGAYVDRIDVDSVGISHGFRVSKSFDIRQPFVGENIFTDSAGQPLPYMMIYQFELRGGMNDKSDVALPYFEIDAYNSDRTKTVLFGDGNLEIINDSNVTTIDQNFGISNKTLNFNEKYTISAYLTNEEINSIRDGRIIIINGVEYKPLAIKGVSFDGDGSVVSIEIILNV